MIKAIAARPGHFVSASKQGTAATEEMLEAIGQYYWGQAPGAKTGGPTNPDSQ